MSDSDLAIPIIDISNPSPEVAQQVLSAASTHGFLFIKNDGVTIPPKDIDDMFELSRKFFHSPKETKQEYAIHSATAGGINRGWVSMQGEALDPENQKVAFNIAPPSPSTPLQPLPTPLSTSSPLISRFQTSCHTLCQSILSLLNTALQIPDSEYFTSRHDQRKGESGTIFRMLYYPASHKDDTKQTIRAGAHSDYGSLTLLFRLPGQPGLELLHPRTGTWVPVPVDPSSPSSPSSPLSNQPPPPILVNIGDLLSFWTCGLLTSTVHRVVFSGGEERYSMAYFCHPLDGVELGRVPSGVIDGFTGRESVQGRRAGALEEQYRRLGLEDGRGEGEGVGVGVLTAKQHLDRRLKVTYGL
ncbi:Clavaminate synthase-like protein [Amniculicola lignicola CBS 123094]|uniref:Clavaminate synthase-like protein n=1 Tax=Amniculicola lignicola CBS 123094 TaxID=1392246 RepID=A0A6A5W4L9_9PLEO|nr:Clavaminate synthase-like protein [Amniculicola lignicola CBS 123094]